LNILFLVMNLTLCIAEDISKIIARGIYIVRHLTHATFSNWTYKSILSAIIVNTALISQD